MILYVYVWILGKIECSYGDLTGDFPGNEIVQLKIMGDVKCEYNLNRGYGKLLGIS